MRTPLWLLALAQPPKLNVVVICVDDPKTCADTVPELAALMTASRKAAK